MHCDNFVLFGVLILHFSCNRGINQEMLMLNSLQVIQYFAKRKSFRWTSFISSIYEIHRNFLAKIYLWNKI